MSNIPVSLSNLTLAIGDELMFQPLDQCLSDMRSSKGQSRFSFFSDQTFDLQGPTRMGIVLWIDRDKAKAALAPKAPDLPPDCHTALRSVYLALESAKAGGHLNNLKPDSQDQASGLLDDLRILFG